MPEKKRRLVEETIEVPKNTGIEGFLHTVRELLKLPRVQSIVINAKGVVEYARYVVEGETNGHAIEFDSVEPYSILRNGSVEELSASSLNAAVTITSLLDIAAKDGWHPVAFVTGAASVLWTWYMTTTGFEIFSRDSLCGFPLYLDRHAPDTALILCVSRTKTASLVDAHRSYKVEMSVVGPETEVEVI